MINWDKLQKTYERKAYRIVQKHIRTILNNIPLNNVSIGTYPLLISGNITDEQIYSMFKEVYSVVGIDYGNRIKKTLDKTRKANILFNDVLLNEILLFLSNEGGIKITSVKSTLVEDLIKAVQAEIAKQGSLVSIRDIIYSIVSKSQTFYKWQALRIARTETTSASNLAAIKTGEESDLELTKTWISVNDGRTRLDHAIENLQVVDFNDTFKMADGSELNFPGDVNAKPSQVINCRCTVAFTAKRDEEGNLIFKN